MPRGRNQTSWLTQAPFAHRGLHDSKTPENSIASFKAAQQAGFGIELDARLTLDGTPVVFHDNSLRRMTGHRGEISSLTINDLRPVRLKQNDATIPALDEVFAVVDGDVGMLIELKPHDESAGLLERAVGIQAKRYRGPVALMSMNLSSVRQVLSEQPKLICGWVIGRARADTIEDRVGWADSLIEEGLDFLAYDRRVLPHLSASRARDAGLPILAWTVTSGRTQGRLQDHTDNIIFEKFLPLEKRTSGRPWAT